jgi:hypothetical protein
MLKVLIMFAPNPLKNPSNPSFFHVLSNTAKIAFLLFLSGPVDFVGLESVVEDPWIRVFTLCTNSNCREE